MVKPSIEFSDVIETLTSFFIALRHILYHMTESLRFQAKHFESVSFSSLCQDKMLMNFDRETIELYLNLSNLICVDLTLISTFFKLQSYPVDRYHTK